MLCEKHYDMGVLNALCKTSCKSCGIEFYSPHLPEQSICENCSEKYNLCQQCGKRLDGEDSHIE